MRIKQAKRVRIIGNDLKRSINSLMFLFGFSSHCQSDGLGGHVVETLAGG
jgi:hypothetical protein